MEFPDKSHQPPKKDIKPVVTGASLAKRPASKRFMDFLLAESPKLLMGKITRDVLVPRAKAGIEEALNAFLAGMLWGDSSNRPMSGVVRSAMMRGGGLNYNTISTSHSSLQAARQASPSHIGGNYEDLIVPTQQDAEIILANLITLYNQYRVVTIADLKELANLPTAISDNGYGWSNLDGARISKVRDGYSLELPRPTII